MATKLGWFTGIAPAVAALLIAGCGTTTVTVADGPSQVTAPTAPPGGDKDPGQILDGQVTVAPSVTTPDRSDGDRLDELGCPPKPEIPDGVDFEDLQTPGLEDATQEAAGPYGETVDRGKTGRYFTGVSVCPFAGYFYVYRVPGSKKFDAWFSKVARRHGVEVRLVDRKYSLATLEGVRAEVMSRQAELAEAGAKVISTYPSSCGGATSWRA